jgi:hypothetical protein
MRTSLATSATIAALAALATAAAHARPAPPDPPVSSDTSPLVVKAADRPATGGSSDGDGGVAVGWAIALCGGAAVAGGAVGFARGRTTQRVTAPAAR